MNQFEQPPVPIQEAEQELTESELDKISLEDVEERLFGGIPEPHYSPESLSAAIDNASFSYPELSSFLESAFRAQHNPVELEQLIEDHNAANRQHDLQAYHAIQEFPKPFVLPNGDIYDLQIATSNDFDDNQWFWFIKRDHFDHSLAPRMREYSALGNYYTDRVFEAFKSGKELNQKQRAALIFDLAEYGTNSALGREALQSQGFRSLTEAADRMRIHEDGVEVAGTNVRFNHHILEHIPHGLRQFAKNLANAAVINGTTSAAMAYMTHRWYENIFLIGSLASATVQTVVTERRRGDIYRRSEGGDELSASEAAFDALVAQMSLLQEQAQMEGKAEAFEGILSNVYSETLSQIETLRVADNEAQAQGAKYGALTNFLAGGASLAQGAKSLFSGAFQGVAQASGTLLFEHFRRRRSEKQVHTEPEGLVPANEVPADTFVREQTPEAIAASAARLEKVKWTLIDLCRSEDPHIDATLTKILNGEQVLLAARECPRTISALFGFGAEGYSKEDLFVELVPVLEQACTSLDSLQVDARANQDRVMRLRAYCEELLHVVQDSSLSPDFTHVQNHIMFARTKKIFDGYMKDIASTAEGNLPGAPHFDMSVIIDCLTKEVPTENGIPGVTMRSLDDFVQITTLRMALGADDTSFCENLLDDLDRLKRIISDAARRQKRKLDAAVRDAERAKRDAEKVVKQKEKASEDVEEATNELERADRLLTDAKARAKTPLELVFIQLDDLVADASATPLEDVPGDDEGDDEDGEEDGEEEDKH